MFCSNCGENIDPQVQFCAKCGAPSPATAQPNPPSPAVTPSGLPSMSPPSEIGYSVPGASSQPPAEPRTDGKATFSLVLGILSIPLSITCILGLASGIPAIILGHMSRSGIEKSMGRLKGTGMATAGLVLGYISIALFPVLLVALIAIPNLLKARISANDSAAAARVRTIDTVQLTYSTTYPTKGYAPDLATLGPGTDGACPASPSAAHACFLDSTLGCASRTWCEKDDFRYSVVGIGSPTVTDYVITATPLRNRGSKTFCSTSDQVVHYRYGMVFEPVTATDCQSWETQ